MKLRQVTWIAAWILFGAASIWIHYEVKVASFLEGVDIEQ